jgi:hypothetical protein
MPKFVDLVGRRFGKLSVARYLGSSRWSCLCDCGRESAVNGQRLREGKTRSCGCGIAQSNKRRTKHGMYRTRAYRIWHSIRQRCENPNNKTYPRYGGRGIKLCDRWQSFGNFIEDMGEPPEGMSIDRIDGDGDYEPGNCRWATPTQQQNNIRTNRMFTHDGKTMTLAQWARELGIAYHVLKYRLNQGWQPPKLFTQENLKGQTTMYTVEYNGEIMPIKKASELSGVSLQTLYWRMHNGKPLF